MPWEFDAQVESTPLSTTGGHTWAAARRLADYLAAAAPQLGLHRPGLRLLELGAGTGWLGVTVARNLPDAALVCLTEQEGGLAHLASNVALNAERGLRLGHVRVQPCDWRVYGDGGGDGGAAGGSRAGQQQPDMPPQQQQQQQEQQQPPLDLQAEWDVIFGSDLIFNEIGSRCLPRVLAALVRPHTQARAVGAAGRWAADHSGPVRRRLCGRTRRWACARARMMPCSLPAPGLRSSTATPSIGWTSSTWNSSSS